VTNSVTNSVTTITGLVLAGGRGSRMGLVDKGLQTFRGSSLCAHVLQRLQPQVGQIIINANQNLALYQAFGFPVWPDQSTDFAGPLAGIQSGLLHCTSPYLLTVPCDSPFLPSDLATRLMAGLQQQNTLMAVAVCHNPETACAQIQGVFCLISLTLLPQISHYLAQGGRKIETWIATLPAVAQVWFDDHNAFRNLNTLTQLQQAEQPCTNPASPRF
jgi:molybdenum cofactor guanylyltransferase